MNTMITEYSKTEAALAELKSRYEAVTFNVEEKKGMAAAKEARAEIKGYRTDLEKVRKEIKAPALQRCQDIDSEAKRITSVLLSLEQPIDEQIKSEEARKAAEKAAAEAAEAARIAKLQGMVSEIEALPSTHFKSESAKLAGVIAELEATQISMDVFEEFTYAATTAKASALERLIEMKEKAKAAEVAAEAERLRIESERAELAKLRAEQAERERAEREAKAKQDELARVVREQQEAEARRLEQERAELERQRKAFEAAQASATKTEPEATVKESLPVQADSPKVASASKLATIPVAAPRPFRPTDMQIIDAVAEVFEARHETVIEWIACMNLEQASRELSKAVAGGAA